MKSMEKRNNLFICIFTAIIIVLFVYVVPLMLVNSYSKSYTYMYKEGNMLLDAYDNLQNSDIDTQYKNSVTIIRKSINSTLQTMQIGYSLLFTYYTVCVGLLLLVAGICLKKHSANISKVCMITAILLFICAIIYMVI